MSRVVVLGAGISGHTAAAFLRKWLGLDAEVIVVSPKPTFIPWQMVRFVVINLKMLRLIWRSD